MLYLSRKVGESVIIQGNIEVKLISVSGKTIKLGFSCAPTISVLRKELFDRLCQENQSAATSSLHIKRLKEGSSNDDKPPSAEDLSEDLSQENSLDAVKLHNSI